MPFYKKIIIAAIVLQISVVILDYFIAISIWIYFGIILATIIALIYGSISMRSGFYSKVFCSADSNEMVIALTFDDGPDVNVTPQVLDILKKQHVRAAFFCIGSRVLKNPLLIDRMDKEGHIVGGHSYSHHFFFDLFSLKRVLEEMVKTEKLIQRIIRKKMKMFRPPYGVTNPILAKAFIRMNYHIIGWNLKSNDTVIKDEQKLFERLKRKLGTANIILLHDTSLHIVPVLDKFINFAKENNYRFIRLDELLQIEAYE